VRVAVTLPRPSLLPGRHPLKPEGRAKIRDAIKADATDLADLINLAGEGMPEYLWLSLIVASENLVTRRLYNRLGFRVVSALPVVPNPVCPHGREWVLMTKRTRAA
jgi:hypothetical protein